MNLIPWGSKKSVDEKALVPVEPGTGTERAGQLVAKEDDDDIVIHQGKPLTNYRPKGEMVQVRAKPIKIAGKTYNIDPRQLIRMIKQVTQTIGEYKDKDNPYANYVIGALRKARSDMVSDLEQHFGINWEIDEASGRSIFYM